MIEKILKMASIRKFVDENYNLLEDGQYINVYEKINLPSEDGDYANYDAVITAASKTEKKALESLFSQVENANVAIIII